MHQRHKGEHEENRPAHEVLAESLDWSDDEIDYGMVTAEDKRLFESIIADNRKQVFESEPKSHFHAKQVASRQKVFVGDAHIGEKRFMGTSNDLVKRYAQHLNDREERQNHQPLPIGKTGVKPKEPLNAHNFPNVAANTVEKLSVEVVQSIWDEYKDLVGDNDLSTEDSLLAVKTLPSIIAFVNTKYQQNLQLRRISFLRELDLDDYCEFRDLIEAIAPFMTVDHSVDGSALVPEVPAPDLSSLSVCSLVSTAKAVAAVTTATRAPHHCCAFPQCLCLGTLPQGLVEHMKTEAAQANRDELEFSDTVLHRIQVVFGRLLHEHRGKLRIRHVFPLLEELNLSFTASRLPKDVWDRYDSYYIDNQESLMQLIVYLTAVDEREVDPLAHLFRYPLPDWLKNEFKTSEILLFQHQFSLIDTDGGGSIDPSELRELLSAFDSPVTLEDAQAIVDKYDIDGNGTVDFVEFMILIYKIQRGTVDLFGNDLAQALMEAKSQIRIFEEIEEVNLHPPEFVEVGHFGGRVVVCNFRIRGPPETVFADRIIPLQMKFLDGYPYRPPELVFNCRLFHVNFCNQLDGRSNLLHLHNVWGSDWSIVKLLDHILGLLRIPQPSLLAKPYDLLYDSLEKEWMRVMRAKSATMQAESADNAGPPRPPTDTLDCHSSLEVNRSLTEASSTMISQVVQDQFGRLNRVQTMHLSVLYVYLFDPSAYEVLAKTTGKSQEEIDEIDAASLEQDEEGF